MFFRATGLFFKWSYSAAIGSWKDFRTTAPMYFVMGNPFLTVPRVFGRSIDRFHAPNVARVEWKWQKLAVIQWKSIKSNENHWNSMETYVNRQYFRKFLVNLARLGSWNRSIEYPNTCGTIKNGFPMKKYIGAVLRKSSQLELAAEIGPFEDLLVL